MTTVNPARPPAVPNLPTIEEHELDGLAAWVAVMPLPFGIGDMLTVAAMLPDGAVCIDIERDGDGCYSTWIS